MNLLLICIYFRFIVLLYFEKFIKYIMQYYYENTWYYNMYIFQISLTGGLLIDIKCLIWLF